jgi:hypothetical protein
VLSNRIIVGDIDERIKRWETWFSTPLGLCKTLHEAVELMKKNEIDARMAIAPVAVAICDSTHEVWIR